MSAPASDAVTTLVREHGVKQIALVVRDLDASVRAYWDLLRMGPWTSYTLTPELLKDMYYHGKPTDSASVTRSPGRTACRWNSSSRWTGPSIFADHLERHGEGLHHVGIYVPDQPKAVAELEAEGYRCLQKARGFGADGDGAFAYFETDHPLATIIEVIGAPKVRRTPIFVYPSVES